MGLRELEGSAPSQVDGFEVGWRDAAGEHRRLLSEAVSVAFEEGGPVRGFPSYRGQRHFPGLYWSATTGGHVGFESWLERDHVMLLDFTPEVTGLWDRPSSRSSRRNTVQIHWAARLRTRPSGTDKAQLRDTSSIQIFWERTAGPGACPDRRACRGHRRAVPSAPG
ncbi:hypothetical protein [Streptomyces sp. WG7]|uniref:hypothetical protein n=1 Tax=Streptomyces sp. WG7 TaxID=3417650 RepID=UPI003CEBC9F2